MRTLSEQETLVSPESVAAPRGSAGKQTLCGVASSSEEGVLAASAAFVGEHPFGIALLSIAVLVPCFWHTHIEAGDLASHTYNAWLAQLIERSPANGLWLARQWNNVLFDIALTRLGNIVGLRLAEKIIVSSAVLIFFWGSFALASSLTGRAAWRLAPCLAILSYGWTFEMGFMNYYLSLGLAFLSLAIVISGKGWKRAFALLLLPVTWIAHPLGAAMLIGVGIYICIARGLFARQQTSFLIGNCLFLTVALLYVRGHYQTATLPRRYLQTLTGADQLVLFGERYSVLASILLAFMVACVAYDVIHRMRTSEALSAYRLPLHLYGMALLVDLLSPGAIVLPQYPVLVGFLTERLSLVTAILACCVMATTVPRKWHMVGFTTIAVPFFLFLYADTGKVDRMETQAERYERILPPGQRIIATISPFDGSRVVMQHIVDRACIGYCFSYGNYEPSSKQFRVRANSGNPFVVTDVEDLVAIGSGDYVVQPKDEPISQIYQCNLSLTELCIRGLAPGEKNGAVGVHPAPLIAQTNPFVGTWKLNIAKSEDTSGAFPKEERLTVQIEGDERQVTVEGTAANGSLISFKYEVPDKGGIGKVLAGGPYDGISGKWIDDNTREVSYERGGKEMLQLRTAVSKDGRTMRLTVGGADEKGKTVSGVAVFEKQ